MLEKAQGVAEVIGLGGIAVPLERVRDLRQDAIDALASSMAVTGLLHPIVVRRSPGAGYWLIAGRHRLEAARKLKWEYIRAMVLNLEGDPALLAEIDENLIRGDLSPAENAHHTDLRKVVYERMFPETKHGGDRKSAARSSGQAVHSKAFVDDTAAKTGKSARSVRRAAARGKAARPWIKEITKTSLDKEGEIDALVKLNESERAKIIKQAKAGKKVSAKTRLKQVKRADREKEVASKIMPELTGEYGVIYIDPPWHWEPWSRETGMDRAAENHYPTMGIDQIKAMKPPAADDCVLFMWATSPMLDHQIDVLKAWGFRYVSNVVWDKQIAGTGYWFRNQHELLLIGVKGKPPAPAPGTQSRSVIRVSKQRHSRKPVKVRKLITRMFPRMPKIELFAREESEVKGWALWGNEASMQRLTDAGGQTARSKRPQRGRDPSSASQAARKKG